ncbi:endo-1,3-alpha-glucanase family glycosylhydrolase [Curvibacter cyanobacteriorum]|uniref:endo-1,3-alpha-glucanase family glycosylhydrolase n=1 Tax=Curvibacter cyanobacteriorum TaxID=3026422 RepID=UPI002361259B|nr:endo-1,3-alpha-glucanase family glycosylhydrolase [Curvibacter sp. HBC61]
MAAQGAIHGKKIYAHYFPPYPLSVDNREYRYDWYTEQRFIGGDEKKNHKRPDGVIEDRPLPIEIRDGSSWKVDNLAAEIALARSFGIDGFVVDIMGDDEIFHGFFKDLLEAVDRNNLGFEIVLMPDMESKWSLDRKRIANLVCRYANHAAITRVNGRIVLSPYNAESSPMKKDIDGYLIDDDWWRSLILKDIPDLCRERVFFLPLFQGLSKYFSRYEDFSDGFADWGMRDPAGVDYLLASYLEISKKYPDKVPFFPVSPQDSRPKDKIYWEAGGGQLFLSSFAAADQISNSWIHLITWNDYGENTQIAPSCKTGYAFLSYLKAWKLKTSSDELIYFHRPNFVSDYDEKTGWRKMVLSSTASNAIGVFLNVEEKSTLVVEINTSRYYFSSTPGGNYFSIPMQTGNPNFKVFRDTGPVISLASSCRIGREGFDRDYGYCAGSSLNPIPPVIQSLCAQWTN